MRAPNSPDHLGPTERPPGTPSTHTHSTSEPHPPPHGATPHSPTRSQTHSFTLTPSPLPHHSTPPSGNELNTPTHSSSHSSTATSPPPPQSHQPPRQPTPQTPRLPCPPPRPHRMQTPTLPLVSPDASMLSHPSHTQLASLPPPNVSTPFVTPSPRSQQLT